MADTIRDQFSKLDVNTWNLNNETKLRSSHQHSDHKKQKYKMALKNIIESMFSFWLVI